MKHYRPPETARTRSRGVRLVALPAALALCLLLPGGGSAQTTKACGEAVIDQYFNTGRIGYHSQACYASALKQVDPDAKMYSGIMGAIRAARARDKAKDEAASGQPSDAGADAAYEPLVPVQPMPIPMETVEAQDAPLPDEAADDPVVAEVAAVDLTEDQAVIAVPTVAERVPLPVVLLALLAGVLTLVGLGGLAVRWIDRTG